jgi:hypothetical protein
VAERAHRRSYPTGNRLLLLERDADDLEEHLDDHETRLRSLERLAWKVLGAAAAGGVLSGGATALLAQAVFGG